MSNVAIIFPHQLYKIHPAVSAGRPAYIVEETLFFRQYNFHKQKLVLHRASMKMYSDYLSAKNIAVTYIESSDTRSDIRQLVSLLAEKGITTIHYVDATDNWLNKRLHEQAGVHGITLIRYDSPNFLNTMEEAGVFFDGRSTYFQTDF